MTRRIPSRLLVGVVAAVALLGCSSGGEDQVVIDDGSVPPDVTATSAATLVPTTGGPPTSALGPPTLTESSAVTTAGIDAVEFGMSVAEAEVAAGSRVVPADGADVAGCFVGTLESGPPGLSFTFSGDSLERLDVVEGAIATLSGAGVGDTSQQLRDLFGEQLVEGADPAGAGAALTFVPQDEGDAGTRIIFVLEDDRVVNFRAGTRPTVDTGC